MSAASNGNTPDPVNGSNVPTTDSGAFIVICSSIDTQASAGETPSGVVEELQGLADLPLVQAVIDTVYEDAKSALATQDKDLATLLVKTANEENQTFRYQFTDNCSDKDKADTYKVLSWQSKWELPKANIDWTRHGPLGSISQTLALLGKSCSDVSNIFDARDDPEELVQNLVQTVTEGNSVYLKDNDNWHSTMPTFYLESGRPPPFSWAERPIFRLPQDPAEFSAMASRLPPGVSLEQLFGGVQAAGVVLD